VKERVREKDRGKGKQREKVKDRERNRERERARESGELLIGQMHATLLLLTCSICCHVFQSLSVTISNSLRSSIQRLGLRSGSGSGSGIGLESSRVSSHISMSNSDPYTAVMIVPTGMKSQCDNRLYISFNINFLGPSVS
jgi:hypothetical protein